ncbi:unnamed protein product, partial [Medioppia subpectinata]
QSFLTYCLLCIIFTTWLAFRPTNKGLLHVIRMRGWKYLLLSVVDVGANYVLIKAFQYTALTSIQVSPSQPYNTFQNIIHFRYYIHYVTSKLLDCIQLPTVLALSWLFIKVRFGLLHILGSCIALMGVGCLVWADIEDISTDITPKNRFLGDMLCLLGAALYAISNVSEEYAVKCYSIVEFLGMIGLFGTILNGIQLYFLERHELVNAINFEKWQEISLVIGFSMSLLLVYITMPLVLQLSNASALNISILSSDFYSLMFGIYLFRFKFHWLYFVSFAAVILGFLVYFLEPTQTHPTADNNFNETNINGEYNNDIDINRVITTNAYITTSPAYNQFNSQFK